MGEDEFAGRDPEVRHLLGQFAYGHLEADLQAVSAPCAALAADLVRALPDGYELRFGLRQLLLAKDAFVRAAV